MLHAAGSAGEKARFDFWERTARDKAKLLAYFLDCNDYAALRKSPSYSGHAYIIVLAPFDATGKVISLPGYSRERVLAGFAGASAKNARDNDKAVQEWIQEFAADLTVSAKNLGVLTKDENAVYQGALTRINSSVTAGLISVTFVQSHLISINAYNDYETPQTITRLIDFSKTLVRGFVVTNER